MYFQIDTTGFSHSVHIVYLCPCILPGDILNHGTTNCKRGAEVSGRTELALFYHHLSRLSAFLFLLLLVLLRLG